MRRRIARGFSSLELLVAIGLLFLIGGFLMNCFITAARASAQVTRSNVLSSLARQQATLIQSLPYDDVLSLSAAGSFPAPHDDYAYTLSFSPVVGSTIALDPTLITRVEIRVSHPDYGARTLSTLKSRMPDLDPGELAFRKYACDQCHTVAGTMYTLDPDPTKPRIPLDALATQPGLPNTDGSMPAPLPYSGPTLQGYIVASTLAPNGYSRYETTTQDAMATVVVDQGGGVTSEEATQIAQWLMNFQ